MKLYNIIVRLAPCFGVSSNHEVNKRGVTASEIKLLKAIHGDDAIPAIEAAKDEFTDFVNTDEGAPPDVKGKKIQLAWAEVERTETQERARLSERYGSKAVIKTFGVPIERIDDEVALTAPRAAPIAIEPAKQKTLTMPTRTTHGRELAA